MIEKLRWKFIAVSLFSVLLTLTVLMATINILNYRNVLLSADQILNLLKENDGSFPDTRHYEMYDDSSGLSKETPFESRYFLVNMDDDGYVLTTNTSRIEAIGLNRVLEYASEVYEGDATKGFLSNYRFIKYTDHNATVMIFLDCHKSLHNFYYFLWMSIWMGFIGFLIVSFLIVIASKKVFKPIAESYDKQKEFITNAGHEIKTPLATISADLAVLEMDGIQNEWTEDIDNQTKRLAHLTNDLIFLAKMEEQSLKEEMVDFPISDVIEETASSFEARAIAENKTYQVEIEPNCTYLGSSSGIEQLVSILLDNALKYSPENGLISLRFLRSNKGYQLIVYNTAEQVKKENISHLFDRFYRQDQSHNSEIRGYGIGLSIAQAIVNGHKGKITASTKDEKSLEIVVDL